MTPAAQIIFDFSLWIPDQLKYPRTKMGPGQVVMNMSPEQREILKGLKSEDLRNIRNDAVFV